MRISPGQCGRSADVSIRLLVNGTSLEPARQQVPNMRRRRLSRDTALPVMQALVQSPGHVFDRLAHGGKYLLFATKRDEDSPERTADRHPHLPDERRQCGGSNVWKPWPGLLLRRDRLILGK